MNYTCKIIRHERKVKTEEGSKNCEIGLFAKKRRLKNRQSQLKFTENQNHKKTCRLLEIIKKLNKNKIKWNEKWNKIGNEKLNVNAVINM